MRYSTGKNCPECGTAEKWECPPGPLTNMTFSCPHYESRATNPVCKYCGKPGALPRQVPAPIPVSECYCDDCHDRCAAEYLPLVK